MDFVVIDKILFLNEKLLILSETCRWALSLGCRSWHANGCLFRFVLGVHILINFFMITFPSCWLPSLSQKEAGNFWIPRKHLVLYLNHLFRSLWVLNRVEETENFLRYKYCYWYNFRQQALLMVNLSWLTICKTI